MMKIRPRDFNEVHKPGSMVISPDGLFLQELLEVDQKDVWCRTYMTKSNEGAEIYHHRTTLAEYDKWCALDTRSKISADRQKEIASTYRDLYRKLNYGSGYKLHLIQRLT